MRSLGVPKKKRTFDLLASREAIGDCFLRGSVLYVLYEIYHEEDDSRTSFVKAIDLNTFDGKESLHENVFYDKDVGVSNIRFQSGMLILCGEKNLLLDEASGEVRYAEYNRELPEHWKSSYLSYTNGKFLYRLVDGSSPELEMDVIDINTREIVDKIDFEMNKLLYTADDLVVGVSASESIVLFSLEERKRLVEFDGEEHFGCSGDCRFSLYISRHENYIILARKCGVVVVNIESGEVVDRVSVVDEPKLNEAMRAHNQKNENVAINDVSLYGDEIVVSGGFVVNYLMRFKLVEGKLALQWSNVTFKETRSKYVGGDLIYGIHDKRPAIWDFYSGEKIWAGSMGTISTKIQVGDGWLVYSSPPGYIQCFQWKKPYISPHRPTE